MDIYIGYLSQRIWNIFRDFIRDEESKDRHFSGYKSIEIPDKIKQHESWVKFPILHIDLTMTVEMYGKKSGKNFNSIAVGGGCMPFGGSRGSVMNSKNQISNFKLDIDFKIYKSYNIVDDREKTIEQIKYALSHELRHIYDYWVTLVSKGKRPSNAAQGLNRDNLDVWDYGKRASKESVDYFNKIFIDLIYASDKMEINAIINESGDFIEKNDIERFDEMIGSYSYGVWKRLTKFNTDKFYNKMLSMVSSSQKLDNIKNEYLKEYRRICKFNHTYDKETGKVYSSFNIGYLEKCNFKEFLEYFDRNRFKKEADRYKRKCLRLISDRNTGLGRVQGKRDNPLHI